MMKTQYFTIFVLCASLGLLGCSQFNSNNDDSSERTLPEAFEFKQSTARQVANNEVTPPDSVNVDAFVVGIHICPKNVTCIVPDGITLSDSLNPKSMESKLRLTLVQPGQFKLNKRYTISLKLRRRSPSSNIIDIDLLGYSSLQSGD